MTDDDALYIESTESEGFRTLYYEKRTYPDFEKPVRSLRWRLWAFWVRFRFVLTGDCGLACEWDDEYGFVPECGCPIHDPDIGIMRTRTMGKIELDLSGWKVSSGEGVRVDAPIDKEEIAKVACDAIEEALIRAQRGL